MANTMCPLALCGSYCLMYINSYCLQKALCYTVFPHSSEWLLIFDNRAKWRRGGSHFLEGKLDSIFSRQPYPIQETSLLIKITARPTDWAPCFKGHKCRPGNLKLQGERKQGGRGCQALRTAGENKNVPCTSTPASFTALFPPCPTPPSLPLWEPGERKDSSGYQCRVF